MGKATKPKEKYQIDPKNISKHATSTDPDEAKTAKERVDAELQLLRLRKQALSTTKSISKPKKVIKKKAINIKKQKKTARALLVADKVEAKVEKLSAKAELRKIRKRDWR